MAANDPTAPETIVLIHGLWMTPLSFEHVTKRYTEKGFKVVARGWPGVDGYDIDQIRNEGRIAGVGITEIVDHYEGIIRELDRPPIIMGHSFGGLVTQILLDRGLGATGVAFASAPAKGVLFLPFSTLKVSFPALSNPANDARAVPLTPEQFHYAFGNNLSEAESLKAFQRYAIPGPDHVLFQAAFALFNPHAASTVNFQNNDRAPLLMIAGENDHISPPAVVKQNYNLYKNSTAFTEYKEFPNRSHFMLGETGNEEISDFALDWSLSHARKLAGQA